MLHLQGFDAKAAAAEAVWCSLTLELSEILKKFFLLETRGETRQT